MKSVTLTDAQRADLDAAVLAAIQANPGFLAVDLSAIESVEDALPGKGALLCLEGALKRLSRAGKIETRGNRYYAKRGGS